MPFNPLKAGFLIVLLSTENGIFFYKVNPFPVDTFHPKTALFLRGYYGVFSWFFACTMHTPLSNQNQGKI